MANATPSRVGQANATGDVNALFLKVFAGEVLTAFHRQSAFRDKHTVRVIPNGKSATFPVTGLASAEYHTPGDEITGDTIRHGERVITIDDLLISPVFIANIDEAKNFYDVRSIYSGEVGEALARRYDQDVSRVMIQAARSAAAVTGLPGGGYDENADYDDDGDVLWQGIFNAGVALDGKDVPQSDRSAFIKPVQYALVVMSGKPIDRDYNDTVQNGSLAQGDIKRINSIQMVKTNNLVQADDRANTALAASRRLDYSPTRVIVTNRGAAGTVQLQDVTMESAYDIRRQGTLMVGKYLVGHDVLRPEAAYELRTGAPSA